MRCLNNFGGCSVYAKGRQNFVGSNGGYLHLDMRRFGSWSIHKSSDHAVTVTFTNTIKFKSGDTLAAGTYRMEVPENSQTPNVTFSQNGKVMATESAKLVAEQKKNDDTEIDSATHGNAQFVNAIRPAGWTQELVFSAQTK